MKILAIFALVLTTATIISAQISAAGNREAIGPSFRHDMTDCCATPAATPSLEKDLDDCMQYYYCTSAGVATPEFALRCGDEYQCFDPATHLCSTDPNVCHPLCTETGPDCIYDCASKAGYQIADRTDCAKHYICDMSESPIELPSCSGGEVFDGAGCVAEQSQCCNCRMRQCPTAGAMIEDTNDCHSFYSCIENPASPGTFIPYGPTPCPPGKGFNYATSECDEASDGCADICPIVF